MKILLVLPDGRINKLKIGSWQISFREAPLTLTLLAGLVPADLGAELTLVDESIGSVVPFAQKFDLVGISVMTGTSPRAYLIADKFRTLGTTVVLGGVHVRLRPEEAAGHADALVIGFAEESWPRLLRDFNQGRLGKRYYSKDRHQLAGLPLPRRDLQKNSGYMVPNTVLVTRGCKGSCEFCSVPAAAYGWQKRPVTEVIDEIRGLPGKRFAISDVHLTQDPQYAKQLFQALIPLKKRWGALASTRVARDEELLDLMQKSGCSYLLIGFESVNNRALKSIRKGTNRVEEYQTVVDKLHQRGIIIQGCFIFGFDEDDSHVFAHTLDLINQLRIDIPRYALFTPYPGTPAYHRLKAQDRLLHENWYYYDTQHVVIKPARMSPRDLDKGFKWIYQNSFKVVPSFKRSLASGAQWPITFIGNLAYKLYIKRLLGDTQRFPIEVANESNFYPACHWQETKQTVY